MKDKSSCPRCWGKYKLNVQPRPVSIKTWAEGNQEITNLKYVCSCGCSWERTTASAIN